MVISFHPLLCAGRRNASLYVIIVDVVEAYVATRCMQLIMRQIAVNYPHAGHLCKLWFATQATAVQIVSCAVDGILMIRGLSAYPHLNLSLFIAIV